MLKNNSLVLALVLSTVPPMVFAAPAWTSLPAMPTNLSHLFIDPAGAKFTVEQCTPAGQITATKTAVQAFSDGNCGTPTGTPLDTDGFLFNCSQTSCLGYSVNADKLFDLLPSPSGVGSVMVVPQNSTIALSNSGAVLNDPLNFCFAVDCISTPGICVYSGSPHHVNLQAGIAYFTNYGETSIDGPGVTVCSISLDDEIISCQPQVNPNNTFNIPTGITLNSVRTKAYITNFNSSEISICDVDLGGQLTSCVVQGSTSDFLNPVGIILNQDNSRAYIANDDSVTMCPIDGNGDLTLGSCQTFSSLFDNPHGMALNADNTRIYVVNTSFNASSQITSCTVNIDGTLSACQQTPVAPFGSGLVGIALNSAETKAYITSLNESKVYACDVNTGVLSNCLDSGETQFNFPEYITLNSTGTRAYIANYSGNTATVCSINPMDQSLTACAFSSETINEAYGVYVTN